LLPLQASAVVSAGSWTTFAICKSKVLCSLAQTLVLAAPTGVRLSAEAQFGGRDAVRLASGSAAGRWIWRDSLAGEPTTAPVPLLTWRTLVVLWSGTHYGAFDVTVDAARLTRVRAAIKQLAATTSARSGGRIKHQVILVEPKMKLSSILAGRAESGAAGATDPKLLAPYVQAAEAKYGPISGVLSVWQDWGGKKALPRALTFRPSNAAGFAGCCDDFAIGNDQRTMAMGEINIVPPIYLGTTAGYLGVLAHEWAHMVEHAAPMLWGSPQPYTYHGSAKLGYCTYGKCTPSQELTWLRAYLTCAKKVQGVCPLPAANLALGGPADYRAAMR